MVAKYDCYKMGLGVNVNLPVIVSFLLLYSLRSGSIIFCFWTVFRSLFCFFFFIWSSMEEFLPLCPAQKGTIRQKSITMDDDYFTQFIYLLYLAYTIMIVVEAILFMYSITLAIGIYSESISHITHYLVCRFTTWCIEILILTVIILIKDKSKGWYMIFLMIIILEFYGFVVVYSFLQELKAQFSRRKHCCHESHSGTG